VVGGVHAGGVVDEVGVDPPAGARVLDPAALGEPRLPPSPTTAAQLAAVDPDRVVGLVADLGVGLGRALT
jgi:hypothetical protein